MTSPSWDRVTLGDVVTLKRGYDLPASARREGDIPIISSSGVTGFHDEAKVTGPGVVTGRYGTLGEVFFIDGHFWPLNTTLYVQDFKGNDPRFVSYFLRVMGLGSRSVAAAVPGVNRNDLHRLPVLRPPLAAQELIASILSAYDDLIENNNRRIQILEEMAQVIYREWFVEFRFPGHEDVPMVDSELGPISEGWQRAPFATLANFVNGYAFKPTDWGERGLPIVKIRELKDGVSADTPRYPAGQLAPKYLIHSGDLLFSWSADLDAYLWPHGDAWLNQHLFNVEPRPGISKLFLFHALRAGMNEFRARALGTTMRHIKRSALDQVETTVPPQDLLAHFHVVVEPMHDLQINLVAANRNLRQAREFLLPRLISGQINVSNLDIGDAEPAA